MKCLLVAINFRYINFSKNYNQNNLVFLELVITILNEDYHGYSVSEYTDGLLDHFLAAYKHHGYYYEFR